MTAIVQSDILFKLSAPNANSGNTLAGYPGTSWGGWLSTSIVNSNTILDNVFTDITGPENVSGQIDYACIFVQNNTASGNSMMNTVAWLPLQSISGSGSSIQMAADPTGISPINSSFQQAVIITSPTIAPVGVTNWVVPTSSAPYYPSYTNGVVLGNLAPTQCAALWLKRTALNSNSPSLTTIQISVFFSTNG